MIVFDDFEHCILACCLSCGTKAAVYIHKCLFSFDHSNSKKIRKFWNKLNISHDKKLFQEELLKQKMELLESETLFKEIQQEPDEPETTVHFLPTFNKRFKDERKRTIGLLFAHLRNNKTISTFEWAELLIMFFRCIIEHPETHVIFGKNIYWDKQYQKCFECFACPIIQNKCAQCLSKQFPKSNGRWVLFSKKVDHTIFYKIQHSNTIFHMSLRSWGPLIRIEYLEHGPWIDEMKHCPTSQIYPQLPMEIDRIWVTVPEKQGFNTILFIYHANNKSKPFIQKKCIPGEVYEIDNQTPFFTLTFQKNTKFNRTNAASYLSNFQFHCPGSHCQYIFSYKLKFTYMTHLNTMTPKTLCESMLKTKCSMEVATFFTILKNVLDSTNVFWSLSQHFLQTNRDRNEQGLHVFEDIIYYVIHDELTLKIKESVEILKCNPLKKKKRKIVAV